MRNLTPKRSKNLSTGINFCCILGTVASRQHAKCASMCPANRNEHQGVLFELLGLETPNNVHLFMYDADDLTGIF